MVKASILSTQESETVDHEFDYSPSYKSLPLKPNQNKQQNVEKISLQNYLPIKKLKVRIYTKQLYCWKKILEQVAKVRKKSNSSI